MSETAITLDNVPCPFCGLACDDLRISCAEGRVEVLENGCPISIPAFAGLNAKPLGPRIKGKPASHEQAAAAAAAILKTARQPLFAGLATDISGMRAAMQLADRCGAVLDHMNSEAKLKNLLVLQDSGWVTTTLSELKNRVDLLVIVGTDIVSRFPRFFERFIWVGETLFGMDAAEREIVYVGDIADTDAGIAPGKRRPTLIHCKQNRLGEIAAALRCLIGGRPLNTSSPGGVALPSLEALARKMQQAKYGVAAWAAPDLDFPHADLAVQSWCELIRDLNRTTRFSGLPLGGNDGDFTIDAVHLWQTGFPFRTSLGSRRPDYDPHHYSCARMLDNGEADALLWISSFNENRAAPVVNVPTIVLGRVGMKLDKQPDVYIPVATPGVDHGGHFFRSDKVVSLPLRKLRDSKLPSVAEAVGAIEKQLPGPAA